MANDGDTVDGATVHWPEDRTLLDLGTVELTALVPNDAHEQQHIIFDPIPRLDGIEPSGDPLLELRAAVYLISDVVAAPRPRTRRSTTNPGWSGGPPGYVTGMHLCCTAARLSS